MMKFYFNKFGYVSVIDIGGTKTYWNIVPKEILENYKVEITCVNLPKADLPPNDDIFTFANGDGCNLSEFRDKQFHIAHSNSVIEHVGDWGRVVQFSNEIKRVADSYFVQTPNYWFPLEPHWRLPFIHWLPKPVECWCLMHIRSPIQETHRPVQIVKSTHLQPPIPAFLGKCKTIDEAMERVEFARLLSKGMFKRLFPEATIITERYMLLPKSFVAVSHR